MSAVRWKQGSILSCIMPFVNHMACACSLAEGQEPWHAVPALPEAEIETDSTIWSLAATESTVVIGAEEGIVAAWDLLSLQNLWQVALCKMLLACTSLGFDLVHLSMAEVCTSAQ